MIPWIESHIYLVLGIFLAVWGAFVIWRVTRDISRTGRRSLMAYLLVWPLIFEAEQSAKKKTRVVFVVVGLAWLPWPTPLGIPATLFCAPAAFVLPLPSQPRLVGLKLFQYVDQTGPTRTH